VAIFGGVNSAIVDHMSLSWSADETFSVWANDTLGSGDITVQWTILAEALEAHSTNFLTGGHDSDTTQSVRDIDVHHSLFMNTSHRQPLVKTPLIRIVNNIIYNWEFYATQTTGGVAADIIGNLYKPGPLWRPSKYEIQVSIVGSCPGCSGNLPGYPSIYVIGNSTSHLSSPSDDNWLTVREITHENGDQIGPLSQVYRRHTPLRELPFPIQADSVNDLESIMLPTVGASQRLDCTGNWIENRDAVDIRLINEYQSGTGIIPATENDVGGYPVIAPGTACLDSDRDGMADEWENLHFGSLDRGSPNDSSSDYDDDVYTDLEEFLNGTDPKVAEGILPNNQGDIITFSGSAGDAADGDLSSSLSWSSSRDGVIGSGGSFSKSNLSAGVHIISASAIDSGGLTGSDEITITVNTPNTAPLVTITGPAAGSTFNQGDPINFSGRTSEAEDSNLTASLAWQSDLDGALGSGGSFTAGLMTVGIHTITAMVTDSGGLTGTDQITITVEGNSPPTVTISAPADGLTFSEGDDIAFSGSASDAEDGDLTASLAWVSNLDGAVGVGDSFTATLLAGSHTITAMATDSEGLSGSDEITITITTPTPLPTDTPTATNTPTPTDTPTPTPTDAPTATNTPTPTDAPTATSTPTPTDAPTATNTPTPTDTPTPLPTDAPTATNTPTPTDTPTPLATDTPTPIPPAVLTFTPTDDTTIQEKGPAKNYGAEPEFKVDGKPVKDALLRFDVSGIGTATVANAKVRLFATNGSSFGGEFFGVTDTAWSEDTVTWATAPPATGGSLGSLGSVEAGLWYELDVTPLVTADGPVSLRVSSSINDSADYASKENANGNAPELVIVLQ
jgi:hypothetical protein